jgi:hypothetical protein
MSISFTTSGDFSRTEKFLAYIGKLDLTPQLSSYAQAGVDALAQATPVRTGLTASSWGYEIERSGELWRITWTNTDINEGIAVAILLEYGHATRNGGYVQGYDYINPALKPVFDEIAQGVWQAVTSQ